MKKLCLMIPIILSAITNNAFATGYYVSNAGNDNSSGLSPATPFLTLQYAADQVKEGDSVYVLDGTYKGFDIREVYGTNEKQVVFKTLGEDALINEKGPNRNDGINVENCSHIVIDGFTVNDMTGSGNGIRVVVSDNCTVRHCRCDHNAERGIFTGFTNDILIEYNRCSNSVNEHGIYVSNSSDRPIVRYNECWGNNGTGIHMNGDLSMGNDGIISDAQLYGNYLHDNKKAAGINLDGVLNPVIYNNVICNNHEAQGIALFNQDGAIVTHGAKIYNNTIIVPSDGRWGILLQDGAQENTEIYNNIILTQHAWRGSISAENLTGLKSDFNLMSNSLSNQGDGTSITFEQWQALGIDQHSQQSDAYKTIFTNFDEEDYHLAANSPAINHGKGGLVSAIVMTDFDQTLRPSGDEYDIGAFEYDLPVSNSILSMGRQKVYPNPPVDFLEIECDQHFTTYQIVNMSGKIIQSGTITQHDRISVGKLKNGLYLLSTGSSVMSKSATFIIMNH